MFLTQQANISIPDNFRITQVALAFGSTYLLLCQNWGKEFAANQKVHSTIFHVDEQSKVLNRFDFDQNIKKICMPSAEQFIVLLIKKDIIVSVDIKKNQKKEMPFEFNRKRQKYRFQKTALDIFSETNLICIQCLSTEQRNYIEAIVDLTYMKIQDLSKPFCCYSFYTLASNFKSKANNHSMLLFNQNNMSIAADGSLQVISLDLTRQKPAPIQRTIRNIFLTFGYCWQNRKDELLWIPPLSLSQYNGQVINLNVKEAIYEKTACKTFNLSFVNKDKYFKAIFGNGLIYLRQTGQSYQQDTVYVIRESTEQLLFKAKQKHVEYLRTEKICDHNQNIVIELVTDIAGRQVQVKKKQVAIKEIFMLFLLHLNEDFDDDLLLDSLNLIVGDL